MADGLACITLLAIWGFRWEIALVLIPEVLPAVGAFPTWTALVMKLWFEKPRS